MNVHSENSSSKLLHLRAKILVAEVVSSRYGDHSVVDGRGIEQMARPLSWDERTDGIDVVRAEGGQVVRLRSSAMQSTPKPGWVLVLTGGNETDGYTWTLYGLSPHQ